MKNRNPSNIEIIKQFISQLNDRMLREDGEFYDIQTRKYNVGTFYLHESMGRNGYEYEVREVLDENGAFKSLAGQPHTSEVIMFFLEGYLAGHFETCEMLGYTLEVVEEEGIDPRNPDGLTEEEIAKEDADDDMRIETAKVLGEYQYDDEEEGDTTEDVSLEKADEADKDGKAEG